MATTAAGTPYVESSDLVATYPGVSLALANHIDTSTGKVLQVVSVTKVNTFSTSSISYVDITGLTASITPSATSSKILVLTKIAVNTPTAAIAAMQIMRGATAIGGGTAVGIRVSATSSYFGASLGTDDLNGNFLDSPASITAQTYKIQCRVSNNTVSINTTHDEANNVHRARTSSTITLMEISA